MSLFRRTINILTDRRDLKEPVVMKDFDERDGLIRSLEGLSNDADSGIDRKKVERDLKLFSIGQAGEKNVFFELKHSMQPIIVLHDVRVKHEDYQAQIDFVIITHRFILALEVKKLFGDVKVTDKGEFQRAIKKGNRISKQEGMYSPLNQVERQAAILEKLLIENKVIKRCPVISAVTFANPKTILDISPKAPASIKSRVIRHDQIKSYLQSELAKESKVYMMDNQLYEISEFLLEQHVEPTFEKDRYMLPVKEIKNSIKKNEKKVISITNDELRDKLKEYRLNRSRALEVKPFYIFTNKSMEALIELRPKTKEALLKVPGIGIKKVDEYGEDLLEILK